MPASDTDLSTLAASHDIITLGMQADAVRRRLHDARTTFVRVADVSSEVGAPRSWPPDAGEIRIVGVPVSRAAALARVIEVVAAAKGVPVSAFSLDDLEQLAAREQITLRLLLEELHAAGLDLVAEAPFDRLQDPRRSIEEVNIAGPRARTPDDSPAARDRRLDALQAGRPTCSASSPSSAPSRPCRAASTRPCPTTGYDDVKRVALARLTVQNIPSIQVDWALYGPKLAQVALTVGADDVDAVSPDEETGQGRRRSPLEEIRRNIRAAGQEPVERNGRFETLAR